jgi:hypothetical protein
MLRRHVRLVSTDVLPRTRDMRWHVSGRGDVLAHIATQLRVDSTGRIDANIELCPPGHLIFVDKANERCWIHLTNDPIQKHSERRLGDDRILSIVFHWGKRHSAVPNPGKIDTNRSVHTLSAQSLDPINNGSSSNTPSIKCMIGRWV